MGKTVKCTRIGVDCVPNDPVDIRCGGPNYLGFDFNVEKNKVDKMKKFIIVTLDEFGIPLASMYSSGEFDMAEEEVWTKERIVKEIKKDANYLVSESKRNYGRRF